MDNRKEQLAAIVEEARRLEEDATHSSQSQFETAREWNGWNLAIGIPATVLAAAAGGTALAEFPLVAAFLALGAAILSGLATFLKPSERAAACLSAGNSYTSLRNDTRIFRTVDCLADASIPDLRKRLGDLNERRNALNGESPNPPRRAFLRARKRIEEGETTHQADQ